MSGTLIYKIVSKSAWADATATGTFRGAEVDIKDGFIHFSAAAQVKETVQKHFAGQRDLLLVSFDDADFGERLKWEVSRGGDLFPHLYDVLPVKLAHSVHDLPLGDDGDHVFPEGVLN